MKVQIRQWAVGGAIALAAVAGLTALAGCTQMPTEKQGISDLRPQISFTWTDPAMASAQVSVDGLAMGEAGQYLAGRAALRVLPGSHELKVVWQGRTLLSERIYLGDGVNKSFVLR